MIKKIANQCATFDGKGKLTVDDLYSVIKVQVSFPFLIAIYVVSTKEGVWYIKFLKLSSGNLLF